MRVSVSLPFAVLMFTIACSSSNNKNGAGAETASSTGSSGNGSGSGGSGTSASSATGSNSTGAGAPSVPVDNPVVDPDQPCGLDDAAFCEQFETASPGGRGGPLDETRWAFSRYGHLPTQFFVREPASTESGFDAPATFCGQPFSNLMPGQDVEFCDGPSVGGGTSSQLNEVFNDQGDFGYNSMMIRQPFDFTGRTGTIVLDVDAKFNPHNLGHGWWVEFWITEDPTPMPYHGAPTVYAIPKNGVGFAFFGFGSCGKENWINTLDEVTVAHEYEIVHSFKDFDYPSGFDGRCFRTSDGILNHFELRISKNRAELLVTDYDAPDNLRPIAVIPELDLTFERGYVHIQHSHYNASKDAATPSQTYRWDNVGFDGPKLPPLRSYDVPDNDEAAVIDGAVLTGYELYTTPTNLVLSDVDLSGATRATFNFTLMAEVGEAVEYRFNGNAWHSHTVPSYGEFGTTQFTVRTFSLEVPLSELVSGDNTLDVRQPGTDHDADVIATMDLSLE